MVGNGRGWYVRVVCEGGLVRVGWYVRVGWCMRMGW